MSEVEGLRPTPNRVRETLFNWLQTEISGATCLDAFSGSGALGFEALSRGAKKVTMLEQHYDGYQQLIQTRNLLNAEQAEIIHTDSVQWLTQNTRQFDIIFLDPPFHSELIEDTVSLIQQTGCLMERGLLYIECEQAPEIIKDLIMHKQKRTGQVQYGLYQLAN